MPPLSKEEGGEEEMSIRITNGGLLTTVQDLGRAGFQQFGVPVSGAMDSHSAAIANILVGNDENEAVLEATMIGPRIEFTESVCIAVTGGDLSPTMDGQPLPMYRAVLARAGQTLAFGTLKNGCRAYIAFAGGLDIAPAMGSRSTYLKAQIGGVDGRKLDKGDEIGLRAPVTALPNAWKRAIADAPSFTKKELALRVVMGPQDDAFTENGIATFLGSTYTVTNQFDRMGYRLDGETIAHVKDGNIISDGISFGAIQIPSEGKPIIMLADRQTVGGYTKIATVITADLPLVAQAKGGDQIRFQKVGIEEAQALYLEQRWYRKVLRDALDGNAGRAPWPEPGTDQFAGAYTFHLGDKEVELEVKPAP